ncbi:MAG: protein jag [Eubacteriales bacterium]|nr:protein jag [Eubacteriales bacterium]
MKSIESSAKTMEEAVSQGLEKLGVSLGDVTIDILEEGSKGLFGLLGGKQAKVRLTLKDSEEDESLLSSLTLQCQIDKKKSADTAPEKASGNDKTAPRKKGNAAPAVKNTVSEGKPAKKQAPVKADAVPVQAEATAEQPLAEVEICDPETPAGKAQQFMMNVTRLMNVTVSVAAKTDEEGNVRVDMHGDTLGILIGRRGETLDALQYLASLNVNRGQEQYTRVTLDTENYRAKREEALTRLANRMANRAVKTGRKVVMEPMNPYERRILHSALQQNNAVTTHSEGDEPNRHVVITLK